MTHKERDETHKKVRRNQEVEIFEEIQQEMQKKIKVRTGWFQGNLKTLNKTNYENQ